MNTTKKSLDMSGKLLINCAMEDELGQILNQKELINPCWKSTSDHSMKTECGQKDFFEISDELLVYYFMENGIRKLLSNGAVQDEFGQMLNQKELLDTCCKPASDHSIKTECDQKEFFEISDEMLVCYFMENGIRVIIRWYLRAIAHCGKGG